MISKITAIIMTIVSLISSMGGAVPSKQVVYTDVAYGTEARQTMDVCFPAVYEEDMGVVLYLHGGGWMSGDKSGFLSKAKSISKQVNCIGVTMNYRYAGNGVTCTDLLKDIDGALAKVKSMAETRGIKCTKVMLAGYSAGAHLALLYAYAKKNVAPIKPAAVISYSGPTDISSRAFVEKSSYANAETMRLLVSKLTGKTITKNNFDSNKSLLLKYSPIKYVSSGCVPTIVVQGKLDSIVPVADTRTFVSALKAKGVTYRYFELPNSRHGLDNDPILLDQSNAVLVEYAGKYLK